MTKTAKAVEAEFEVLGKEKVKNDDAFIAFVTRLMDEIFVIPGTRIRFGLDPLIGLIPGFGAWGSALVSLVLIVLCSRRRVPRIVLAHMGVNVLINAVLDTVPVVGDTISVSIDQTPRTTNCSSNTREPRSIPRAAIGSF